MKKLLVPVDFEETTVKALNFAVKLSQDFDYEIHVLHLLDSENNRSTIQIKMDKLISRFNSSIQEILKPHIIKGKTDKDISKTAETIEASFIIMGTHKNKRVNKVFGSRAIKVLSENKTPFIIIQEEGSLGRIQKIAMTIDLEKESVQIVKAAIELSKIFGSEIVLVGGDHSDPYLKSKVAVNVKTTRELLADKGIKSSVELIDRKNFIENFIDYCSSNEIDLIAATYYLDTFTVFSSKFVQKLMENKAGIPVLTLDAQAVTKGTQYSFMSI